ncbi:hypothetical protein QBC39DRAFT_412791 [Podospora conica]|nr:hypothetical protein QBC39DRAFT_412791 [Schizothecium conicum]
MVTTRSGKGIDGSQPPARTTGRRPTARVDNPTPTPSPRVPASPDWMPPSQDWMRASPASTAAHPAGPSTAMTARETGDVRQTSSTTPRHRRPLPFPPQLCQVPLHQPLVILLDLLPRRRREKQGLFHGLLKGFTDVRRTSSATPPHRPFGTLPREIFDMIVRCIPNCDSQCRGCLLLGPMHDPRALYPFAKACKVFWYRLREVLFEFDVMMHSDMDEACSSEAPKDAALSALAWGIANQCPATAKYAIEKARKMGKLQRYASIAYYYTNFNLDNQLRLVSGSFYYDWLDPISLAIVRDDPDVVYLLTKDADVSFLRRTPENNTGLRVNSGRLGPWTWHNLRVAAARPRLGFQTSYMMRKTHLHFAILMRRHSIAKILLGRYAEVDQSTLQWNEPTGLQLAAFLGDIEMVRLMLDGDGSSYPHDPWVPRIRSQLSDARAYSEALMPIRDRYTCPPPMIMAALGAGRSTWPGGSGNDIFTLLAAKDRNLVTEPYYGLRSSPCTPLMMAVASFTTNTSTPFNLDGVLSLLRLGALTPDFPTLPTGPVVYNLVRKAYEMQPTKAGKFSSR